MTSTSMHLPGAGHGAGSDRDGRLVRYPPDRVAAYLADGAWRREPLGRSFHDIATRFPDRPAVITAHAAMTYAELDTRTDQVAAGLIGLGLEAGDPVIFQLTNRLDTVVAWYGCVKAGLIPVATLAAHRRHEISDISRKIGAVAHIVEAGGSFDLIGFALGHAVGHPTMRHVITVGAPAQEASSVTGIGGGAAPSESRLESLGTDVGDAVARQLVEQIERHMTPTDVVAFQLSGGTTGTPKVIPRLHGEYWNNALWYAQRLGWTEDTRVAHLIPIIHNAGISCGLHAAHSVGACLVLATADARSAFALMDRIRATDVLIGHGHYQALELPEFDRARVHLRTVVLSGAKVGAELFARADSGDGRRAVQLFGMSEGLFTVTPRDAPARARQTTVGTPIADDDEIRILEPGSETTVPDEQIGELCCRGPYTIRGYFDAADHNAIAFTSDGFYRTGDLAKMTVIDGVRYLSIEGRIKDVINRGGEKVNAGEIELLLVRHPAVATAAVVAMPDVRLGEKTCAYLVPNDDEQLTLRDIQEHLAGLGVAKFKWPERIEWLPELPQTNVGKVDKKRLRRDIETKVIGENVALTDEDRTS